MNSSTFANRSGRVSEVATRVVRELTDATLAYSLLAPTYDELPNPMLSLEQRILRGLLPDLRGKQLVDLGCGTGRWLHELAASAKGATGIDASPEMLRVAGGRVSSGCTFMHASCPPIPLPTAFADVVICSFLGSYVADAHALAEELYRISRPDTEIFLSDLHPNTVAEKGWRREFQVDGRL